MSLSPLFTPGRDVIFGNTTAGNTTAVSTNFSVSTQETSAFYQGFLKPIDLQTLAYFIRQGYSRELLFWLFTDSFTLELPNAPPFGYHYSPPDDYGCSQIDPKHRCFIDWVHNAAYTGLTVEEKTEQASASSSAPKGGAGRQARADRPKAHPMHGFVSIPCWLSRRLHRLRRLWCKSLKAIWTFNGQYCSNPP